jgi:enolase-phosphatase E1
MIKAVVLDIEGTTSSLAYFRDELVPLANDRLPGWLAAASDSDEARAILAETRKLAGLPRASTAELAGILIGWARQDVKAPPLKDAQGMIWQQALAAGDLTAQFYPDVAPALRAWHHRRLRIFIYSSGSAAAQRAWFDHGPGGSLLPYLSGHFDTRNAGPKLQAESYGAIAAATGLEPGTLVFLSDVPAELDAAAAAGWQTRLVRRDGAPSSDGRHPEITSFAELDFAEPAKPEVALSGDR